MSVKVRIKPNWSGNIEKGMKLALLEMTTDIHARSVILAPKDTRALANSGRIEPISDGYKITFGSARVPYARIHELGGQYIKAKHYLGNAGDSVARGDKSKYFRNKV